MHRSSLVNVCKIIYTVDFLKLLIKDLYMQVDKKASLAVGLIDMPKVYNCFATNKQIISR